jgi:hypothetical protein
MVEDNLLSISESLIGQGVEVHTSNPSTRETEAEDHDPVLKKKKNPTTTKNLKPRAIEKRYIFYFLALQNKTPQIYG